MDASAKEIVQAFGHVAAAEHLSSADGVLPSGYEFYACVLHAVFGATGNRVRYGIDGQALEWSTVGPNLTKYRRHMFELDEFFEGSLDSQSATQLIEILGVSSRKQYVATEFTVSSPMVIRGAQLRELLLDSDIPGPTLWFPVDQTWIASSPYDDWQTYIAASGRTGRKIVGCKSIDSLRCESKSRDSYKDA